MSNRHLFRSIVLQTLFEIDFRKADSSEGLKIFKRNIEEFAAESNDNEFLNNLYNGVLEKREKLDEIISKAAPDWPLDKISVVDRNILRLGLYELLFSDRDQVPPKVAINEAIELAKSFGGENSGKFVNGVLGTVYKELGEPGKDEDSNYAKSKDSKNLPKEILVGAVVYAKDNEQVYLALVHDVFGHWTLSKGKVKDGEDPVEGVKRKAKEEVGLDVVVEKELGSNEYVAHDPERGRVKKQVKYFLARSDFGDIKLGESGGLDDAKWFKLKDILELNFYDDVMPIVIKAVKILAENQS
ncbi:MAG: transcription antitermination factor NusB [Candidatus Paceibacterota bacterium]|nr:MAG: transcription antitermination factor NusB [Candidatus Paceibacterota bacterium]